MIDLRLGKGGSQTNMWEDWFGLRSGEVLRVKLGTEKFEKGKLVTYQTCSYSGRCYLVSDPEDDLNKEWLMDSYLERVKK